MVSSPETSLTRESGRCVFTDANPSGGWRGLLHVTALLVCNRGHSENCTWLDTCQPSPPDFDCTSPTLSSVLCSVRGGGAAGSDLANLFLCWMSAPAFPVKAVSATNHYILFQFQNKRKLLLKATCAHVSVCVSGGLSGSGSGDAQTSNGWLQRESLVPGDQRRSDTHQVFFFN